MRNVPHNMWVAFFWGLIVAASIMLPVTNLAWRQGFVMGQNVGYHDRLSDEQICAILQDWQRRNGSFSLINYVNPFTCRSEI